MRQTSMSIEVRTRASLTILALHVHLTILAASDVIIVFGCSTSHNVEFCQTCPEA